MGQFKCELCSYGWSDSHNFSSCPNCSGLGLIDRRCTCRYWRNWAGARLNVIAKKDLACPIHGKHKEVIRDQRRPRVVRQCASCRVRSRLPRAVSRHRLVS